MRGLPLAVAVAVFLSTGAGAGEFFAGVDDLPAMPGLREATEETLVFDKPDGRIVELAASGAVSADAVLAFYAAALRELGWLREAGGGAPRYVRDREELRIIVAPTAGAVTVRFAIAPL